MEEGKERRKERRKERGRDRTTEGGRTGKKFLNMFSDGNG